MILNPLANHPSAGSTGGTVLTLSYLVKLAEQYDADLQRRIEPWSLGDLRLGTEPALMGVINLSPDSWYRESVCLSVDAAVRRGHLLHAQGADLIDLGAESSLTDAARVDDQAQRARLIPVVQELSRAGMIVSAETYRLDVARAALEAGARVLNLTGTDQAGEVYAMAANHAAGVILCYVQGPHVREVGEFPLDADPIPRMHEYFQRQIDLAEKSGLRRLILDPGLGFYYRNLQDSAVRVRHQLVTFLNTFRLRSLGYPICHALPHAFEFFGEEVRSAEPFFAVFAALGRTDLFRTHEVAKVKAVLETMAVI